MYEGFSVYQSKNPLTLDSGHIFVKYTMVTVVHMIYNMHRDVVLALCTLYFTTKTCNYVCFILTVHISLPSDSAAF